MSLARPSSSALRPSTSRRFTSLPSVTAAMAPALLTASTSSGSGLFHTEAGWMPTRAPKPTGAIGAHFVNSSASGPMPTSRYGDHIPRDVRTSFDASGLGRARPNPAQVRADDGLDLSPDAVGQRGVAWSLLDHALEQARDVGDAAGHDRVQVARGQEPRARRIAMALGAVGDDVLQPPEHRGALDRRADVRGRGDVQQVTDGRIGAGQVHGVVPAHGDDARSVFGGRPRPSHEQRATSVPGQAIASGESRHRAPRSSAIAAKAVSSRATSGPFG